MRILSAASILALMVAIAPAADKKNDGHFQPGPASSYPSKQTNDNVTIAAVPYDSDELVATAFGKLNPNQYGVLPVLVVIQNDTGQALRLSDLQVQYIGPDNRHVEATPASDVPYLAEGPQRPQAPRGTPIPIPRAKHKSPLSAPEIESRAFAAKMLPPNESASGFFYFQSRSLPGSSLYITGIQEASTGKDLFYFEIPLESHR